MLIEEAINARLRNYAPLYALIGGSAAAARVFPLSFPQTDPATGAIMTYPVVTFRKITSQDQHALRSLPTLTVASLETQVWAWQYADAKSVGRQIWNALYGYIGSLPVVKAVATLTSSGAVATAQVVGHNCVVGDSVAIAGASPNDYDGDVTVDSVVDLDHFTYAVTSGLATPATGTITCTGTVSVSAILSSADRDLRDPETQLYQLVQDFTVWHKP